MKVVVVDPWYFTPPYDRELCAGLALCGHDVTLVRSSGNDEGVDDVADDWQGVKALGLFIAPPRWLPRPLELIMKGLLHILGMFRLLMTLRRIKPDVVHFQWLSLPIIDAVFLPIFRRIAPVVLTVHDSNPYMGSGPLLLRAGSRMAISRCDQFVVHNVLSKQRLEEQGLEADRIHQIAHGLLESTVAKDGGLTSRTDQRMHFLQFGKLKDYKGTDIFLEALALISEAERGKLRVSVVGRPYIDTQPLTDLVVKHRMDGVVDFRFDFISDAEMSDLFAETDFLVFPYREIDTSGVLMVAMARGIPVIASDIGCFSEMLTDGKQGILVPPNDPKKLALAIRAVIAEPEKQALMAAGMTTLCHSIPSWEAIAENTTLVYERAQQGLLSQPVEVHT